MDKRVGLNEVNFAKCLDGKNQIVYPLLLKYLLDTKMFITSGWITVR